MSIANNYFRWEEEYETSSPFAYFVRLFHNHAYLEVSQKQPRFIFRRKKKKDPY